MDQPCRWSKVSVFTLKRLASPPAYTLKELTTVGLGVLGSDGDLGSRSNAKMPPPTINTTSTTIPRLRQVNIRREFLEMPDGCGAGGGLAKGAVLGGLLIALGMSSTPLVGA